MRKRINHNKLNNAVSAYVKAKKEMAIVNLKGEILEHLQGFSRFPDCPQKTELFNTSMSLTSKVSSKEFPDRGKLYELMSSQLARLERFAISMG